MTNATVTEESVHPFGGKNQNTLSVQMKIENVTIGCPKQYIGFRDHAFPQQVDKIVCGKINEHTKRRIKLTRAALHGRVQTQDIAKARHLVTYILREHGFSFPHIGDHFDRDHTTVMSGFRRACALIERGGEFRDLYDMVCEELGAGDYVRQPLP